MTQARSRLLPAIWLATAGWLAPFALVDLGANLPCATAQAQAFPDPGFGDPYATGGYGLDAAGYANSMNRVNGPAANPYFQNNLGTMAPMQPDSPARPAGWPGSVPQQAPAQPPQGTAGAYRPVQPGAPGQPGIPGQPGVPGQPGAPTTPTVPAAPRKPAAEPPWDGAEVVAIVGSEVIQACEVLPNINQAVAQVVATKFDELSPDPRERELQLNEFRKHLMKQSVEEMVKIKVLLTELHHKVPEEGMKKHEKSVRDFFNKEALPRLMEMYKATSIIDLDKKLRELGSSLDAQRIVYTERELALSWLRQNTKGEDTPPTHEKMLDYFHEHHEEWATPPRARWEQLTASFDKYPDKSEAYRNLARWGSDVQRGVPFGQVAKARSDDFAADQGGVHDWTQKGSLKSDVMDTAIFALPVGAMSQIFEDEEGFHIVRVLAREDAKAPNFTEVQAEIKKRLTDGLKDKQRLEYMAKLRQNIPVWTIFDEEDATARNEHPGGARTR